MACFADINVSQGSVATYARCYEAFNFHLTAYLPKNLPVNFLFKSVKIWQNYRHESVVQLFGPPCICIQNQNVVVEVILLVSERRFYILQNFDIYMFYLLIYIKGLTVLAGTDSVKTETGQFLPRDAMHPRY